MKLSLVGSTETRAVLSIDGDPEKMVIVRCPDARVFAAEIAKATNRDFLFSGLLAALKPFTSAEMGDLLLDTVVSLYDGDPARRQVVSDRLGRMFAAVNLMVAQAEARGGTANG